jgi:glycosyltransferase involved in cell wall biosynthesis
VALIVGEELAKILRWPVSRTAPWRRRLENLGSQILARFKRADLAIFHEFLPPPYGGGNQFLLALRRKLESLGWRTEANTISASTRACLYNSFNFDFDRLRRFQRPGCRMVHRVDGPIGAYRGFDDGTDQRIWQINHELADATIFQSRYSLEKHEEMGLKFANPVVIANAADPAIFHARGRMPFDRGRKIRLLSSSWSDNPNKGTPFYRRLEEKLDWSRFSYTFVGRSQVDFARIRMIDPVPSEQVAELLRDHDIFITASRNDPCSNSVIEALTCGLPCLYLASGGHPELVGEAGFAFASEEEAVARLDQLVQEYEERQARIAVASLEEVASRYLTVMGLEP